MCQLAPTIRTEKTVCGAKLLRLREVRANGSSIHTAANGVIFILKSLVYLIEMLSINSFYL